MNVTRLEKNKKNTENTMALMNHQLNILRSYGGNVGRISNKLVELKALVNEEYDTLLEAAKVPEDRSTLEILKDALKDADTPELKKELRKLIKLQKKDA